MEASTVATATRKLPKLAPDEGNACRRVGNRRVAVELCRNIEL